jgi:hypothetical protein
MLKIIILPRHRLGTNIRKFEKRVAFVAGVRLVVQARPVSYAGHFHSTSDPMVERVWWTAAWTVKVKKRHFLRHF